MGVSDVGMSECWDKSYVAIYIVWVSGWVGK